MKYKILSLLNDNWYRHGRPVFAVLIYFLAELLWFLNVKKRARNLCCASLRFGVSGSSAKLLKKIIHDYPYTKSDTTKGVTLAEAAGRSIIVKWPEINDGLCVNKGIVIITFTRTFSFYLRQIDLKNFEKYFNIVLEPSWSGYADPDILAFIGRVEKIIIQSSELQDRAFLNCFPESFVAASFGASDWVDFNRFSPSESEKKYDSIYVANTNPLKRIKRYLDAIKKIVDSGVNDYIGCIVCASWGGAEKLVSQMVVDYNLKANVKLEFDLTTTEVVRALNESKVNILLSYKEGSNRSLFESIFCNIPVVCLYENVGVNKAYINEHTGALIFDEMLEDVLIWMRANHVKFSPRSWAMENISPKKTSEKLFSIISSSFDRDVDSVFSAKDILIKTNNPEVTYLDAPAFKSKDCMLPLLELFMSEKTDYATHLASMRSSFDERINIQS